MYVMAAFEDSGQVIDIGIDIIGKIIGQTLVDGVGHVGWIRALLEYHFLYLEVGGDSDAPLIDLLRL